MKLSDPKTECGDSRIWGRPGDIFADACSLHDFHYQRKHDEVAEGEAVTWARKDVDAAFLRLMLVRAGENKALKAQAYFYYGVVRAVGWLWWRL